jgi:hypothetical protein
MQVQGGHEAACKVIKSPSSVLTEYKTPSYAYRGFGLACLDQLEAAGEDFNSVMKEGQLDRVTAYNRCLCKGLLAGITQQWATCLSYFNKAAGLFPRNVEARFYRAVVLLSEARERGRVEGQMGR